MVYETFANKVLPAPDIRRLIAASTVSVQSKATGVEVGILWNSRQEISRVGEIVLLNRTPFLVTAFASRCDIDFEYPAKETAGDFDRLEKAHLRLCDSSKKCTALRLRQTDSPPTVVPRGQVLYQTFGLHDVSLLYFNLLDTSMLAPYAVVGLDAPVDTLINYTSSASMFFNKKMIVFSEQCLARVQRGLKRRATTHSTALMELALTLAVSQFLKPLGIWGEIALSMLTRSPSLPNSDPAPLSRERVTTTAAAELSSFTTAVEISQFFNPFATLTTTDLTANAPTISFPEAHGSAGKLANGKILLNRSGERPSSATPAELTGVVLPTDPFEQKAVESFLSHALMNLELQYVTKNATYNSTTTTRGFLFAPQVRMVVNYELVRHGLTRLDTEDSVVRIDFPELRDAARAALKEGAGLATRWRNDVPYVTALFSD